MIRKTYNKRVLVTGVFDIFHLGHNFFLEFAKSQGDELFVLVAKDANVKKIKGKLPIQSENIRKMNIVKNNIANNVILGSNNINIIKTLDKIKPDIFVLGYDQKLHIDFQYFPNITIIRAPMKNNHVWKSSLIKNISIHKS